MPFPDANRAEVTREKICDYLLNLNHQAGRPKAVWFGSLGYTLNNWEELARDLKAVALACEAFIAKASPYGVKYETPGMIGCAGHRPGLVVVVWIIEGNAPPRLVTAYPSSE